MRKKELKIVTIGGGGGHAQVLRGLKTIPGVVITAICPSTDSGGSTGVLQSDYGISGYLGDATKCMAALCSDKLLAEALLFRYGEGSLHGHSVKNVLFLGLERAGGMTKALQTMYRICGLGRHRVMPVTAKKTELCAKLKIGNRISGETNIDHIARSPLWHPDYHAIQDIYLRPTVSATKTSLDAVHEADWCVICPGDLYSSILPVLLPKGMSEAFARSKAKVVMVLNIMTKKGETDSYRAGDFVMQVEKRLGRACDVILCNNAPLPKELLVGYALERKVQFETPATLTDKRVRMAPLLTVTKNSELYHNPVALARELRRIFRI